MSDLNGLAFGVFWAWEMPLATLPRITRPYTLHDTRRGINTGKLAVRHDGWHTGYIWQANGVWYADPQGAAIQNIPSYSEQDAADTCKRLHVKSRDYPAPQPGTRV